MKIIERNNLRVITSEQLSEVFDTDLKRINYNFSYNKKHYEEGKHYFVLRGDELRQFKTEHEIHGQSKHAHTIYLWTEKGVFLHAKSLNTKQAWDAYSQLVDEYFKKVEEQKSNFAQLSPQLQVMIMMENKQRELEDKQVQLEAENEELRRDMKHLALVVDNEIHLTDHQCAEIQEAVKHRVGFLMSQGYDSHFQSIFSALKVHFTVPKYNKIARKDFEHALEFINGWYPKKKEETSSR